MRTLPLILLLTVSAFGQSGKIDYSQIQIDPNRVAAKPSPRREMTPEQKAQLDATLRKFYAELDAAMRANEERDGYVEPKSTSWMKHPALRFWRRYYEVYEPPQPLPLRYYSPISYQWRFSVRCKRR